MYPTIEPGDLVLVLRRPLFVPERGDVVIVHDPDASRYYVRRIIAGGGEVVSVEGGVAVVDGVRLDEPYTNRASPERACNYPEIDSLPVPPGSFFVMGDNRSACSDLDSRVDGPVAGDKVRGKVILVF